jgi:hypothetical protein
VWKTLLAVVTSLVVVVGLPIAGWFAGLTIGERTCDVNEFLGCIAETIYGGVIGFSAGLMTSLVLLAVFVLRYRRRRKSGLEPGDMRAEEPEPVG